MLEDNLLNIQLRHQGFTLIEILIVVAILAIIAAIAFPSYQSQTQRARRADCQAAMMQARQAMERYYTKRYTYVGASFGAGAGNVFTNQCPIDGGTPYYTLDVDNLTATTFTITATALAGQANDTCGDLSLDQAGTKGQDAGTVDECW